MKKIISSIALLGLVVLAACSGDSPTAQVVPTAVPQEWAITSLTVSDDNPDIGATVLVEAIVQQNGADPPNGTPVEFLASGGQFANGTTEASVGTQSGRASIAFTAATAGSYVIQARVRGVTRQVTVTYRDPDVDEELVIQLPLIPDVGSFDGGETVVLRGTGIRSPVEVTFAVEGVLYPAVVTEVIESDPLSAPGQITVTTPFIAMADRGEDKLADVTVKRDVGGPSQQQVTLPEAFTFMEVVVGGPPTIYALEPAFGGREGGEQVNVLGRNLEDVTRATFSFRGNDLAAEILTTSPDGLQMVIITPRFSATPLEESEFADFVVDSPNGQSNTLTQAFLVVADDPTPELASLSPIAGPLGGGTLVTLFGSGFKVPVQVRFGDLMATDVNVVDDPSPADQDLITCLSPDYSQQGQVPPVTVDVTVTNMTSGRTSNARQFIYGDNLYISGNSPSEGMPGDQLLIFGAGFEDPLQVRFGGNVDLQVLSVSGTEIAARFPPDLPVTCADRTAQFEVRLIESNQIATGGSFTLLGNTPTVIDVEPTFVQADATGNYVDPSDVTITGSDFADTALVRINQFVMPNSGVTVFSDTTIEVTGIPAPNQFGLVFNTTSCITPDGLQGQRKAPTPVDVTVINLPGNCANTLPGGLIYEPGDTTCVATSAIEAVAPAFPPTDAGTCSSADVIVSNGGAGTLEVYQMSLQGRFFFDGGASSQTAPGFEVPPFGSAPAVPVYFCPDVDNGAQYFGNLSIQNNSPQNPFNVEINQAFEAFPILGVSTSELEFFGPYPEQMTFDISNAGTGDLSYTVDITGASFSIVDPGPGTVAAGGAPVTVTIEASGTGSGEVTVTAAEPDAQNSPQTVNLTAN